MDRMGVLPPKEGNVESHVTALARTLNERHRQARQAFRMNLSAFIISATVLALGACLAGAAVALVARAAWFGVELVLRLWPIA